MFWHETAPANHLETIMGYKNGYRLMVTFFQCRLKNNTDVCECAGLTSASGQVTCSRWRRGGNAFFVTPPCVWFSLVGLSVSIWGCYWSKNGRHRMFMQKRSRPDTRHCLPPQNRELYKLLNMFVKWQNMCFYKGLTERGASTSSSCSFRVKFSQTLDFPLRPSHSNSKPSSFFPPGECYK